MLRPKRLQHAIGAHATYGGEMPHAGALQRVDYAPRFAWHPQEQNTRMSSDTPPTTLTVFFGFRRIAQGSKAEVLDQLRRRDDPGPYLVFDDQTGTQLDLEGKTAKPPSHPTLYRPGRVGGTREMVLRTNYIVVYEVDESCVRILRLLHAAQQWP